MLTLTQLISWRYLRKHALRMVLATLSIALGVATLVASQVLNRSTLAAVENTSTLLAGQGDLHVTNGEMGVDEDLLSAVQETEGVAAATPLFVKRVTLKSPDQKELKATLLGVRPKDEEVFRQYNTALQLQFQLDAKVLLDLEFLFVPVARFNVLLPVPRAALRDSKYSFVPGPVVAVSQGLRQELPPETRWLQVLTPGGLRRVWIGSTVSLEGAGIAVPDRFLFTQLEDAQAFFGQGNRVTRLEVLIHKDADKEEVRRRLADKVGNQGAVHPPKLRDTSLEDTLAGVQVGMTLAATAALFVGMFLVYNTLAVTVAERRHDIGIMRALGATRGQIRSLFATEALILGVIGSGLGLAGGLGLARLSLGTVREVLQQQFSGIDLQQLTVSADILILSLLAGIGAALLASIAPAAAAAAEPPSDALRRAPVQPRAFRAWLPILTALLSATIGLLMHFFRSDLPPRWGTYYGLYFFGTAFMLATPIVARWGVHLLRPLARSLGTGGRLASDDLARAPARTGLTIGALALGLALTIVIAGLIASTEEPIFNWVDRAIRADLFVTAGSPITAGSEHTPMDASLEDKLRQGRPEIREVVPVRIAENKLGDKTIKICALPLERYHHMTALEMTAGEPEAWRELMAPGSRAVVVSDNFALQHRLRVGDDFELESPSGARWQIVGTIVDYTWNRGTIFMDRRQYIDHFKDSQVDIFHLYLKPGADAAAVRADVDRQLGGAHGLVIQTSQVFRQYIEKMLYQFYSLLHANAVMALAVAFLGVANTLAISVLQRRRELGLLRAVGATRWQVAWSVLAQALLIGVLGLILGVALGALLQVYALEILMVEEAGQFFAFLFPLTMTLVTIVAAVIAAQVSGAVPALRAAYLPISEAVAYE